MSKSIINKLNKNSFQKLKWYIRHYSMLWYYHYFNRVVRKQLKDYKSIPILIISFNQLYYLKQLVNFLKKHKYSNIVIIDNNSSYPPLLDYFEVISKDVTVHRLKDNLGHLSFWKHNELFKQYSKGYYVVTDPDVVPIEDCPDDFLNTFRLLLDKAFDRTKVGFSLAIGDIPDFNPNKSNILAWEDHFWKYKISQNLYKAEIDTTFALYRPKYQYRRKRFTKAWRTDHPLQARHGGWYIDINNLTEEQEYYIKTANASASWLIDQKGELINTIHKPLYDNE